MALVFMHTVRHRNIHKDVYKQINPEICTDSFALGSFGPVLYNRYQHVAEFLQWCVRNVHAPSRPNAKHAECCVNLDTHDNAIIPLYMSQ